MTPVFCFLGFLGSGKTSLIQDLLEAESFPKVSTLYIANEEGEEELRLPPSYKDLVTVQSSLPDKEAMIQWKEALPYDQIILECNGMESVKSLAECLPYNCFIRQTFLVVEAGSFCLYYENLRQLTVEKIRAGSQVIFNRIKPGQETTSLRRLIRLYNFRAAIFYEYTDGTMEQDGNTDLLPYDTGADEILISNEYFGIFQLHFRTFPEQYLGKKITFTGFYYQSEADSSPRIGRRVMTCCEADIEWIPFRLQRGSLAAPPDRKWIQATVICQKEAADGNSDGEPILKLIHADETNEPNPAIAIMSY